MAVETDLEPLGCFFCYHPIPPLERYVVWQGCQHGLTTQPDIRMHAKCAVMLGERLIGDAFTANPKVDEPEDVLYLVSSRMKYSVK